MGEIQSQVIQIPLIEIETTSRAIHGSQPPNVKGVPAELFTNRMPGDAVLEWLRMSGGTAVAKVPIQSLLSVIPEELPACMSEWASLRKALKEEKARSKWVYVWLGYGRLPYMNETPVFYVKVTAGYKRENRFTLGRAKILYPIPELSVIDEVLCPRAQLSLLRKVVERAIKDGEYLKWFKEARRSPLYALFI